MPATRQSEGSITFAVDDVIPAEKLLRTISGLASVSTRMGARAEACSHLGSNFVAGAEFHPLVAAVKLAWLDHRPLVLSPDILWVTIAQGIAQHIRINEPSDVASGLQLSIVRPDFALDSAENHWDDVIDDLSLQLAHSLPRLRNLMQPDFSTTSYLDRLAGDVALLEAVKPEIEMSLRTACGIPEVTLEGDVEDWSRLEARLEDVSSLGLAWWTDKLKPLAEQWRRSAGGDIDREFWRGIYKTKTNCILEQTPKEEGMDGWVTRLFPYTSSPDAFGVVRRNPMLNPGQYDASRGEDLPGGLSRVEVVVRTERGEDKLDLYGGFIGIEQVPETGALRARTGWSVARQTGIRALVERLELHAFSRTESVERFDDSLRRIPSFQNLPMQMLEFYSRFDGGRLHASGESPVYFFRPLRRLNGDHVRVRRYGSKDNHLGFVMIRFCEFGDDGYAGLLVSSGRGRRELGGKVVHISSEPTAPRAPIVADNFAEFLERALFGGPTRYFEQKGFEPAGYVEIAA